MFQDAVYIAQGLGLTLALTVGAVSLGLCLALILSIMRYNAKGVFFIRCWVSCVRGTPVLLQLSFVFFVIPTMTGMRLSILWAGIVAFGLNSSVYLSEILRAGIESIPAAQFEAAKTLAIPRYYMWRDIIFPQVLRAVFPSFMNEIITLLKETALIGVIGGGDIMRQAQLLGAQNFTYFVPLCITAFYYYILIVCIEKMGSFIGKRGGYAYP